MASLPSRDVMLDAFLGRDTTWNGRFLSGVLTTGIYCLPSCSARKPRPENVRFFATEAEARQAGLRACLRCRPDRFYRGEDPDLSAVETLVEAVREDPSAYPTTRELARAAGVGATKLNALFRAHLQRTPAAFLGRERTRAAAGRLAAGAGVTEAAYAAGYESMSAFHDAFRREYGLTPGAWRTYVHGRNGGAARAGSGAAREGAFTLALPRGYRAADAFRLLGRDPESPSERVDGRHAAKALMADGQPVLLRMELARGEVRCTVEGLDPLSPEARAHAHAAARRLLGLGVEPGPFERHVAADPRLAVVAEGRRGLRLPGTADVFEALTWAILGQQVNVAFAATLRRAVIHLVGVQAPGGLLAHPDPSRVADLDPGALRARKLSGRKSEYLLGGAAAAATGELHLEAFPLDPATRVEKRLLALRGLGPWSAHYIMMRGCGFPDCVPVGDTGLTEALRRLHGLDERPDTSRTLELMEPFAPWRSLATLHLWQSLGGGEA